MKLYSAAGIGDLSDPSNYLITAPGTFQRLGYLELLQLSGHPSYLPIPTPARGLNLPVYASQTGFPMREIVADYPGADCWVAVGLMLDPINVGSAAGQFFTMSASNGTTSVAVGSLTRYDLMVTHGQNKLCCVELIYNPKTGVYKIFVNGIQRQTGTSSVLNTTAYPMAQQLINFNSYATSETATRFYLTDYYIGVVDSVDDRLGNFKITKLAVKTTTLSAAGMTPGAPAQLTTGDHAVEFDVAPLNGQVISGVIESVRAYSPGPTASLNMKRKVNGVETAAVKISNIPTSFPATIADELATPRVMAPRAAYVTGTPLTECKLSLSIVPN